MFVHFSNSTICFSNFEFCQRASINPFTTFRVISFPVTMAINTRIFTHSSLGILSILSRFFSTICGGFNRAFYIFYRSICRNLRAVCFCLCFISILIYVFSVYFCLVTPIFRIIGISRNFICRTWANCPSARIFNCRINNIWCWIFCWFKIRDFCATFKHSKPKIRSIINSFSFSLVNSLYTSSSDTKINYLTKIINSANFSRYFYIRTNNQDIFGSIINFEYTILSQSIPFFSIERYSHGISLLSSCETISLYKMDFFLQN